jgi:putative methionine-R-sulfoxide reductase with GAF domain
VHNFPGHIACDSGSNSEVVVPIISKDGSVLGVFDLDHLDVDGFSEEDKVGLEAIGSFVETLFSAPSTLDESKAH